MPFANSWFSSDKTDRVALALEPFSFRRCCRMLNAFSITVARPAVQQPLVCVRSCAFLGSAHLLAQALITCSHMAGLGLFTNSLPENARVFMHVNLRTGKVGYIALKIANGSKQIQYNAEGKSSEWHGWWHDGSRSPFATSERTAVLELFFHFAGDESKAFAHTFVFKKDTWMGANCNEVMVELSSANSAVLSDCERDPLVIS